MAYLKDNSSAYSFFGGGGSRKPLPKSISKSLDHPDYILKKAKDNPAKAVDAFMSPIRTITKTAIEKASKVPTTEEQLQAFVEKILLEHDLIAPNPRWKHPFK